MHLVIMEEKIAIKLGVMKILKFTKLLGSPRIRQECHDHMAYLELVLYAVIK